MAGHKMTNKGMAMKKPGKMQKGGAMKKKKMKMPGGMQKGGTMKKPPSGMTKGGTIKKPVGLVYIGICFKKTTKVYKFNFKLDRKANKMITSQAALNIIRNPFRIKYITYESRSVTKAVQYLLIARTAYEIRIEVKGCILEFISMLSLQRVM